MKTSIVKDNATGDEGGKFLNSRIISATFSGHEMTGLQTPIEITLKHNEQVDGIVIRHPLQTSPHHSHTDWADIPFDGFGVFLSFYSWQSSKSPQSASFALYFAPVKSQFL